MNGIKAHSAALFWALLLTQQSVMAADTDISFHGTLLAPPPCVINEGGQVDVDFTERVGISKVDGVNYRVPVNYQITCEDGGSGLALSLSLNGNATAFDSQALQSDQPDLGIRIYQNDKAFTPNSTLNIDLVTPPRLEAVPVKRAGATLKEGAFEAWATLQANYQ